LLRLWEFKSLFIHVRPKKPLVKMSSGLTRGFSMP
jgi:hypothetical protein